MIPYENCLKIGPYEQDGCNYITLIKKGNKREQLTIEYSRYLMEMELGRNLGKHEFIIHKNENSLDDQINNLQLVIVNSMEHESLNNHAFHCCNCNQYFILTEIQTKKLVKRLEKGQKNYFCTQKCAYYFLRNK